MMCTVCIRKWLATQGNSSCPHCRASISESSLVQLRWVSDLTEKLSEIETMIHTSPSTRTDLCREHESPLSVFCEQCKICVCHRCALWGAHRGHPSQDLAEVYDDHVEKISKQITALRTRQKELLKLMQGLSYLKRAREERSSLVIYQ